MSTNLILSYLLECNLKPQRRKEEETMISVHSNIPGKLVRIKFTGFKKVFCMIELSKVFVVC